MPSFPGLGRRAPNGCVDARHTAPAGVSARARRAWLRRRYGELAGRSDAAHTKRWWSLFRVDAETKAARVVWADSAAAKALVLPADDPAVPLNSCYVLRCPNEADAWAVAVLLNSPLAAAWLNAIAEPASGGYRRYLGWTVGLLPLPTDWPRAREILAGARRLDDESLLEACDVRIASSDQSRGASCWTTEDRDG